MARLLKTYVTSVGFFDLAVAAPSMKAALEAWGAGSNLFHQGFAKETNDPAIVTATMAHPGVVLKRPVGSNDAFKLVAELPKGLSGGKNADAPTRSAPRKALKKPARQQADEKAARQAAFAFEEEQKRRERQRQEEEAAREKERKRRAQDVAKAEAALKKAEEAHQRKIAEIDKERVALDKRSAAEKQRWKKQRDKLEADLRQRG